MVLPIMFFLRRAIFIASVLLIQDFTWGQLTVQIYLSLFMCFLLQWFLLQESRFANNMETFNEVTMILLAYLLFCFTDIVPKSETRSNIGLIYIGISLGNIAVHLFFMLGTSFLAIKVKCKRR